MKTCKRRCKYRTASYIPDAGGCDYLLITGKSRVAQVYKQLGIDHMTDEARVLLEPRKCPFFESGPRAARPRLDIKHPGTPKRRQPSRLSFDQKEALKLVRDGHTDDEIAKMLGAASRSAVCQWRIRNGIPCNKKPPRKYDWNKAMELYVAGKTDVEISEALGCDRRSVYGWRQRTGGLPENKKPGRP